MQHYRRPSAAIAALACSLLFASTVLASTGKTLHSFESLKNGANPQASLISDSAGNLYGTTYFGGEHSYGEVFELTPTSGGKFTQTRLYSFAGTISGDGAYPAAALARDSAGNFYGTTAGGGVINNNCPQGCGTVFELAPKSGGGWTETVLFSFPGGSGGALVESGVALDASGNVYGTTTYTSGAYLGYGVAYKLTPASPSWTETVLYTFTGGPDGGYPTTTPVFDTAGNLYGTALVSSNSYGGVAYELSPGSSSWTQKVIHTFNLYPIDGGQPEGGLIFDSAGNLYGTASHGGTCSSSGTVFELIPSSSGTWTEKQLYCFGAGSYTDGAIPEGTIAFDASGNIYGTTFEGGKYGYGAVYQLTPTSSGGWKEHIIKNFTAGSDGATGIGGVTFDPSGYLYAVGYDGASPACLYGNYGTPGCGTVIRLTPTVGGPWPSTTISQFNSTDGAVPMGGLISDTAGNLYGTVSQGGSYGSGEVFRFSKSSSGAWTKKALYDFTGVNGDGIYPSGNLLFDSAGNLYGTTQVGGNTDYCSNYAAGCGIVFELTPTTSGPWKEKILYTFQAALGGVPTSGLIFDKAGNLYGTTQQGGLNYCSVGPCGMVYELSPAAGGTWNETTLYQFTGGNDGGNPFGELAIDGSGNLFGTTNNAGSTTLGTAFELSPGTSGTWTFNVIYTFGSVNSDPFYPLSGLVWDNSGNLYGTAYGPTGGFGLGTVYKLSQSGGVWSATSLYTFTGAPDGNTPWGGATLDTSGNIYGTTWYGGTSANCRGGCGTVFKLAPNGSGGYTESILYSFSGAGDGAAPVASVLLDSAGNLYTTTSSGGGGHQGTLFEVLP
jgi:uncharacterized repeat protein (TIGR03803 family)